MHFLFLCLLKNVHFGIFFFLVSFPTQIPKISWGLWVYGMCASEHYLYLNSKKFVITDLDSDSTSSSFGWGFGLSFCIGNISWVLSIYWYSPQSWSPGMAVHSLCPLWTYMLGFCCRHFGRVGCSGPTGSSWFTPVQSDKVLFSWCFFHLPAFGLYIAHPV